MCVHECVHVRVEECIAFHDLKALQTSHQAATHKGLARSDKDCHISILMVHRIACMLGCHMALVFAPSMMLLICRPPFDNAGSFWRCGTIMRPRGPIHQGSSAGVPGWRAPVQPSCEASPSARRRRQLCIDAR